MAGAKLYYPDDTIQHAGVVVGLGGCLLYTSYLLSFGCTGYKNGDFTVFHRLYDACNITVISSKNTVGFYDMDSKVEDVYKRQG